MRWFSVLVSLVKKHKKIILITFLTLADFAAVGVLVTLSVVRIKTSQITQQTTTNEKK